MTTLADQFDGTIFFGLMSLLVVAAVPARSAIRMSVLSALKQSGG